MSAMVISCEPSAEIPTKNYRNEAEVPMRHRTNQPPQDEKNTGRRFVRDRLFSAMLDRTAEAIHTSTSRLNQTEGLLQFGKNGHSNLAREIEREYDRIVDDAVLFMHSDYASLQMLFPERGLGGELRLLAFRGFNRDAARFWKWLRADSKSTCGIALRDTARVVAPDIAACDFMAAI